jgi:hypothetical protein
LSVTLSNANVKKMVISAYKKSFKNQYVESRIKKKMKFKIVA